MKGKGKEEERKVGKGKGERRRCGGLERMCRVRILYGIGQKGLQGLENWLD